MGLIFAGPEGQVRSLGYTLIKVRGAPPRSSAAVVEPLEPRRLLEATPLTWFRADSIPGADGTAVPLWFDSSGRGNSAAQSDAARQPDLRKNAINGKPVVHFDATSNDQLAFTRPVSGDFTITVVFRSTQGLSHGQAWYNGAGLVDGEVAGVTNDFGLSLNSLGQVLGGTGRPDRLTNSGLGFNDGNPHVAVFQRTQSTGAQAMYVDGRLFAQGTGGIEALTASPRLTIGSLQTNINYFTGDIAEIRIYSSALGAADRQTIEGELAQAYGISPLPARWFTNPVIHGDFPDPGVLQVGRTYYAFATNGASNPANVQAARSTDLVQWTMLGDALPTLPAWAQPGRTWAPDAALMPNGTQYNLYFTAWSAATGRQAIGVATSTQPAGPYSPRGPAPLVADFSQGGAIDPSVFSDSDGTQYLLWKNDGNAVGQDTNIYIQRLAPDGLSLVGSRTWLMKQDQPWEGPVVEGPVLWKQDGRYFLFYSANYYASSSYATGYAVSSNLLGPYVKPGAPLVRSENGVLGPGGEEIVVGPDGNTWMLYHSWEQNFSYRSMSADWLQWVDDAPVLRGPSRVQQPVPVHVQAAPALNVARSDASGAYASGSLSSLPNSPFTLRFYATPPAGGSVPVLVGSAGVSTDSAGNARFVDVPLPYVAPGQMLTATATNSIGETSAPSAALAVRLTGDINGDGTVGFPDLVLLAQHYNTSAGVMEGDVNGDGAVNFTDLTLVAQNYNRAALSFAVPARALPPAPLFAAGAPLRRDLASDVLVAYRPTVRRPARRAAVLN
jgi:arabinan endo-1,5-alpha-L-arabinosidase